MSDCSLARIGRGAPFRAAAAFGICALCLSVRALADDWELIQTDFFRALAVNPQSPSVVYAATPLGVRRSDDGGATWSGNVSPLSSDVRQLAVDPRVSSTIYAISGSQLYGSVDGAENWALLADPGTGRRLTRLVVDRLAPSRLYVTVERRGCIEGLGCYWWFERLQRSEDGGSSWADLAFSSAVESISAEGDTVYASTHSGGLFQPELFGLIRSMDGGRTFQFASRPTSNNGIRIGQVACDPASPRHVYVSSDDGLFESSDGGSTWRADSGVPVDSQSVASIAPGAPNLIYVTTASGLYVSSDGGMTWSSSLNVPDPSLLAVGDRGAVVYVVVPGALYRRGASPTGQCEQSATTLCLNGGRFRAEVVWRTEDGRSGAGQAVSLTSESGYFWFFEEGNVELVVKVLDGRTNNGHFWVFCGALSDVAYTITVTDTETGAVRTYDNLQGSLASLADTRAF